MIEITKTCAVAFMRAINPLAVQCRAKHVNWKESEDGENLFFKVLANRFWLPSKRYSWFNKIVHGQSSIKRTSWKGKAYVHKSGLDADFVKKIILEIVIGKQMKGERAGQNY